MATINYWIKQKIELFARDNNPRIYKRGNNIIQRIYHY